MMCGSAGSGGGDRRLLGRWGEALVADWLRERGWRVIAAGWHCRYGEIDLIAEKSKYLIFTEVELRESTSFALAREAVDRRKQEKLRTTAQMYLTEHPTELQPRFDVAEVYAPQGLDTAHPEICYIPNAFQ